MTNAEAAITENAASVAGQGAQVAPEKASPKKGTSQKKGASQGRKERRKARPRQRSQHATRREQGRQDPGPDRAGQGGEPGRDYESNLLAGAQRARVSLDRRQEARPQDRVHEERGRRSGLSSQEGIEAAAREDGGFFTAKPFAFSRGQLV